LAARQARSTHPLIKNSLRLEAFLEAHHIVVASEGSSQELFEDALAKRGLERRCVLRIPHFMSMPFVVASTIGVRRSDHTRPRVLQSG
jgi:hypothetical protein